jgi:hypothetical protein
MLTGWATASLPGFMEEAKKQDDVLGNYKQKERNAAAHPYAPLPPLMLPSPLSDIFSLAFPLPPSTCHYS